MNEYDPLDITPVRERVAKHAKRQRDQGLVRISVWVPQDDARRLRDVAKKMRAKAHKPLPGETEKRW